uniref:VWFA domain-containing protein n=1 Tax=Globodera pallida TaxID=36090 RepID=A0A183BQ92_GLOPA
MCAHIFVVLDCSSSIFLDYSNANSPTQAKFNRALEFISTFVSELAESDLEIDLILFGKYPKIVKKSAKSLNDVKSSFTLDDVTNGGGKLDFLSLLDLLLEQQNSLTNFELILLLEVTHYKWIPASFILPCPVRFVALSDNPNCASSLLSDLCAVSRSSNLQGQSAQTSPWVLCRDEDAIPFAKQLAELARLNDSAIIRISSSHQINVRLTPKMHKDAVHSFEGQIIKRICDPDDSTQPTKPTFRLLGFSKNEFFINIPSSSLCHIIIPKERDSVGCENWVNFHLLAEVLGAEGQIAVLMDERTNEEFVLKPYRDDPSKLWMLCLQLPATIDANQSYKQSASTRIYWTDQHGIQSDVQRLQRLLKKADRSDQFKQELRRIATYATALGYHDFAGTFADVLERKVGSIPEENKATLQEAVKTLRKGGFKQIMQTK